MTRKAPSPILILTILLILFSILFFFLAGFLTVIRGLTVISILFVLLGLLKKEVGLLGIGMIAILDPFTRVFLATGGNLIFRWNTNNYILLFSAVFLWVIQGVKIKDATSKFLFFLIILCIAQLTYSTNLTSGSYFILNLLSYFGFLAFFIFLSSQRPQLFGKSYLVIAFLGLTINIMYQLVANELSYIDHSSLAQSGMSVLFTVCLGLSTDNKNSRRTSLWIVFLSSVMFILVFITGSRSGSVLAFIALLYIVMKSGKLTISNRVFSIIVGSITILALSTQLSGTLDSAQYRFSQLFNNNLSMARRTSNRSDLFIIGWNVFLDHPLGIGTGSIDKAVIRSYSQSAIIDSYGLTSVHSALSKILAENGLLGGILLLFFTMSFSYYYFKKTDRKVTAEIGLLCSAVIFSSLFVAEFQGKSLFYLAAGTTFILYYQKDLASGSQILDLGGKENESIGKQRHHQDDVYPK